MRTIRVGWTVVAVVVATVGCGSGTSTVDVGTTATPTGPTDVVLRVASCCGFTPIEYHLGNVPTVTVYGDGTVVTTGPVTEQYPPHALPNLLTGRLSRDTLASLVTRAERDGLLGELDFGEPSIADASTTIVTVITDRPVTTRVDALDLGGPPDGALPGISASQREARDRVASFVDIVTRAATKVADQPYDPVSVALFVRPANQGDQRSPDESVVPGRATWPLGDLATFGTAADANGGYSCGVLTGAAATTALAAAEAATTITQWESTGAEYSIVWRPLLPDEDACPTAAREGG